MKTLVALGDLHCGHLFGLVPPEYQLADGSECARVQGDMWRFYLSAIARHSPIDILVVNGDAIDGKGKKSGGTELITTDIRKQCKMAAEAIRAANAKKVVIIYGTAYHTGTDDDWEGFIADMVGATLIGGHEVLNCNGTIFDFRHFIEGSRAPYHEFTAMARTEIDALRRERKWGIEFPDVICRSHGHHFAELYRDDVRVIRLPSWQWHTKFGGRICSGLVDVGLCWFKCEEGGTYTWGADLMDMRPLIRPALVL